MSMARDIPIMNTAQQNQKQSQKYTRQTTFPIQLYMIHILLPCKIFFNDFTSIDDIFLKSLWGFSFPIIQRLEGPSPGSRFILYYSTWEEILNRSQILYQMKSSYCSVFPSDLEASQLCKVHEIDDISV